jgi:hypothetical protein
MSSVLDPKDITFDEDTKESSLKQEEVSPALSTPDISFDEEPTTLSDLGLGAAQGATFGFSDEVLAALQAAKEVVTTEKTLKDLPSLYRQLQQVEQQKIAEARERSPIAFTTGEIGAGILPALFTGGATAVASGAKAAPGFLRSAFGAAKAGAGYGALAAAGTTEKPIEETGEFVGEVAKGGLSGATIGGVLGAAGGALKKLQPDIEDIASLRQAKTAYEEGKAGRAFTGEKARDIRLAQESKAAVELEKSVFDTKNVLGKQIGEVLETSTKPIGGNPSATNAALDIQSVIENKPSLFGRDLVKDLSAKADQLAEGTLSPKEANSLRGVIKEKLAAYADSSDIETKETLRRIKDALQNELDEIPGFAEANQNYTEFLKSTAETIFGKGTPAEVLETYLSEKSKPTERLFKDIESLIRKSQVPGTSGDTQRKTLINLQENLAKIEAEKPGFLKSVGFDPEKFISTIKKEGDVSTIRQVMGGWESQAGTPKEIAGFITPRATMYSVAEKTGRVVGAVKGSTPVKLASKVYSAAEPELRSLSEKLMSNPATRRFGESLAGSLDKPGTAARRAALLSIMQQSAEARRIASEEE